ncbi:uncharacterized protein LOC111134355 isoform X1 [Crassostrea virginica]
MITVILWLVAVSRAAALSTGCHTRADVTFMIDSSDSVGQINFNRQLDFLKDVTNKLNVGQDQVHVSALTFSSGVHNKFYLNDYARKSDVLHALSGIQYFPGNTDTADAIKFMSQQSFSPAHGARGDVPHIAVLLTDGPSTTKAITKLQAQTAKDNSAVIYTVGVGSGVDVDELTSVSSNPDLRYSMFADNYDTLNSLSDMLATKICNELPPDTSTLPAPTGCLHNADVVFMVDSSTSVGSENFQKTQNALKNIITNMDIGHNKVQVGVMQYSSYPMMGFPLKLYGNRGDVLHAVENLHMTSGGTNTADAIKFTTDEMFSATSGARSNVPRIAILLTNGGTVDSQAAINAANVARQAGIGINVVAVGNSVNQQEIQAIANQPAGSHVVTVNNFDQLEQQATNILNQACAVSTTYNFASSSSATCSDKITNCNEYGSNVCRDYPKWAEANCKKTCGLCPYQYIMNFPKCTNKLTNCESYGKDVCTSHGSWAQDNCKLYCGFCGTTASSNGFYGMCNYKGKMYQTGEKWTDGCDYECVCRDGNKGDYQCYNRCPLYYNLPSMCTLVKKDGECCLQPVCNFNPSVSHFNNTAMATTATGIPVCAYKSKMYFQGQTWKDGCQYQCTCIDASKGLYSCEQLCPSYSILPAGCHLQKTPGSCCQTPSCEFDQQQGSYTGYGFTSGEGTAQNVVAPQPCVDVATNCKVYGKSVCTTYGQWASNNCRKYCGICQNSVIQPAAGDVCIFKGKTYLQGQSWEPDCSTRCSCENAHYGYYRCNDACPSYNNLPAGCNVVNKRGECCPVVNCQSGVFYTSSQNINSIGNGGLINVLYPPDNHIQTPPYGQTQIGSGGTGFLAPTLKGCLYNGQVYTQGQMWDDGCKFTCTCLNAGTGDYKCREKCPSYQNLASTCVMVTDTNDPCCMVPKCGFDVSTGQIPVPVPSYGQATSGMGVVKPPMPTLYPTVYPDGPWVILNTTGHQPVAPTAPTNVKQGYCMYKNQRYDAGQTWEDGCDYNCVCDDGATGHYKCIDKCRTFDYVPQPYCRLTQDPNNPCCQVPECKFIPHNPEIEGQRTTPSVQGNFCVYNGKQYQQGQSWYDGCSYKCTCEDAEKGIYRCLSRCPEILNAEPGCNYITDPRDPTCCRIPDCAPVNPNNPEPHPIPPKTYQGQIVGTPGKCVYKGVEYSAGERWEDGCDFTCTCTDALRGHYECVDRCPVYTNLPDNCRMVNDFANPCCKKPDCSIPSHPGGIEGTGTTTPNPALPQTLPPKQQYCVYKDAQYLQGQTWEDGCNYKCRCDDSSRGIYTCNQRCATVTSVTPGCTMKTDPRDSCCLVEVCPPPTPAPGQTTPVPTIQPLPFTGKVNLPTPSPVPGQPAPSPKPIGFCVYKGVTYMQGQKWDDGCDYTCDCYDAEHGKYRCNPKCPRYMDLPEGCRLHKDPANPCCDIVECAQPTPAPTPGQTPPPGQPNPNPTVQPLNPQPNPTYTQQPTPQPKCTCEYKGQQYLQGQQWYDGCDFSCICEDCVSGVYRCNQRCPTFQAPPAECTLVSDPKDPLCCKIPECPTTGNYNTAPPLVIQGGKATPSPTLRPIYTPQPTPFNPNYGGFTGGPVYTTSRPTPAPTPAILIPGRPYPSGTPYPGGTYPPGTVPTQPPRTYTPYPGATYPVNYTPNPSAIPTFKPGQTYPPFMTPYPSGTYPPRETYPLPTVYPGGGTYPPGFSPQTTQVPYSPVVVYFTNAPLIPGGTYPPRQTPFVGGTYPTGTVPPRTYTPYVGGTYPPSVTFGPYFTQPTFRPYQTYPTNKTPYVGGTYPTGTVPPPTPYVGGTYPPNYTPRPTPTPKPQSPILVPGQPYPSRETPYPYGTFPTGTVPYQYTPYIGGTYPPSFTFRPGQTPPTFVPGQTYPTDKTPYPSGTYPPRVTVPPYTPFPQGTYPPQYTPPPYYRPSTFRPGGTYPTNQTPYPYGTYPTGTVPMGTPFVGGTYPPGFTFPTPQPTTQSPFIPGMTYPTNMTPYPGGTYPPRQTVPPVTPYPSGTYPTGYTPFYLVTNYPHYNGGTIYPPGATPYPGGPTYPPNLTYPTYTPYPGGTYPPIKPSSGYFTGGAPITFKPYQTYPPNQTPYPSGTYPPGTVPPPVPYPSGTYPPGYTDNNPNQPYLIPGRTYPPNLTPYPSGTYPPGVTVPFTPYPQGTYPPYFTLPPQFTTPRPTPSPQPIYVPNTCIYKGKSYTQGQRWQDGCDYDCVCEDQMTGVYKCTEKCPRITDLNPGCQLVQDINEPCCKKPYCPPNVSPIVIKAPTPTTIGGKPAVCVYKGVSFKQGESWKDGCDLVCICENGTTGFYRCDDRCPVYQLTDGCTMEADPDDSCCKKPVCHPELMKPPTVAPTPSPKPGEVPSPTPSPTPYILPMPTAVNYGSGPNGGNGCLYKGVSYNAGQTWKDGCFYTCECLDMQTGRYRCKDRCPSMDGIVPPPNCQIVSDPADPCCKMMQCQQPTPAPTFNLATGTRPPVTGSNIYNPNPVSTPVPNPFPTTPNYTPMPTPKNICIMNGKTYSQGQTWYDGCARVCVCEDGRTGYYRCSQRCNTYDNLPSTCTLIPDPNDPTCCQVPQCTTPTPGPNQPVTVKGQPGSFTGFGITETLPPTPPTTFNPFLPTQQPTPAPQPSTPRPDVCIYNGLAYKTGEKWQDGCKYNCVCVDGNMGQYKCTERCPTVPRLSAGCTLETDPSDYCCKVAVCRQTTTPAPGQPTPPPTKPPTFCVYKGVPYTQGQTWQDGCSTTCRCDDADNNLYNCFDRCPQYPDLPAGCTKTADPNDPCCLVPVCSTPKPTPYNPMYPTTTPAPNQPTTPYNPYVTPLPKGEIVGYNPTTQNPYNPSPKPTFCVYKGKQYTNGQTWQDGCDYNCECIDQATGRYKCTERCPSFPVQPSCFMVPSQTDNCCRVQYCPPPTPPTTPVPPENTTPVGITLVPNPGSTLVPPQQVTTAPIIPIPQPGDVCIYNGRTYTQGQAWYVGCDQKCVCDDGRTGHYTCNQRCPQYEAGSQCTMVPDPQDPECCKVPQCPQGNTVPPVIVGTQSPTPAQTTPYKIVINPNGPIIFGTPEPSTPVPHMCVYKGQMYQQGQKWQDGCDYVCECVDSVAGRYMCTERCPNLNQIPLTCKLKYNPDDPCCPLPDCPAIIPPTAGPGSTLAPTAQPPPMPAFCVYNGVPYKQGESWKVGCEKICRCDDAMNSQINCDERCPSYPPPKPGCRLVTDPTDQCCQAPICIDVNSTNPFTVVTGNKGTFQGTPQQPQPGQPSIPQIYGKMMCVYQGKAYSQGQRWDDGCQFQCECIDQQAGRYKCTERCARHPQVPSYCTMTQDPNDACCQSVYCPIQPTAAPTKPGQVTPSPGMPNPYTAPPPLEVCVYNGQAYRQGQEWFDGCDKKCVCVDAKTGYYSCRQRCNVYPRVPAGCTLVPDPNDPTCCKAPSCPVVQPGATPTPGVVKPLEPAYGTITGNGTPPPEPVPTIMVNGIPQPATGGTNVTPTPRQGCFYKNTIHKKGDRWQDGCDYICECMDDMTGRYRCTERCQKYPNLPNYCQLVQDPNDQCCGVPYCGNPNNPTPLANIPSQYQTMPPTTPMYVNPNQPSPIGGTNTPSTSNGFCVYKGVYYKQGQSWQDGCDKICTCDDVTNNLYSCRARCPEFNQIPDTCRLVADKNDPCCVVPDCNVAPTMPPGYTGSTTPRPVFFANPVKNPGFSGQTNVGPNNPLNTLINGTGGACVYKGKVYQQNAKWQDGCKLTCQCLDAFRGQYKCTYTCPQYYNLPWYCTYEQDPNNACCQRARCDESKTTPKPQPSTTIKPVTITYPTVPPEVTRPQDMCRYTDNTVHVQGATWDDGCNYRCVCVDAKQNNYRCDARCRVYSGLPSYCTLETDPADSCCRVPKCQSGQINYQPIYNNMAGGSTPAPNAFNVVPIGSHNTIYGSNEVKPGSSNPFTSSGGYSACFYKGVQHREGDSWQDGCEYVCTCVNAKMGEYKCVSKCPIYPPNLPTYCRKVAIPGQCCPKLSCDIPGTNGSYIPPSEVQITPAPTMPDGSVITPSPNGGLSGQNFFTMPTNPPQVTVPAFPGQGFPISQSQITMVRDQCIFPTKNGNQYLIYNEGEKWNDGCDYTCTCKDGASGYYECISSCPTYNNLESSRCYMVRVDGKCCSEPRCTLANGQVVDPTKVQTSFPIVPSLSGGYVNFRPDTNYSSMGSGNYQSTSGGRNVCIYKGRQYQQSQSWSDGCDFDCRCDDASTGQFSCTPRCPVYTELPSFCTLDTVPGDCCKKLNCPHVVPVGTTTTPKPTKPSCDWCRDTLDTCESYGQQACVAPYIPWAKRNCPNYCNLCEYSCDQTPPTTTPLPVDCRDKLDNCADYGKDSCTGIFEPWARENCQAFCSYCGTTPAQSVCHDESPEVCAQMDISICTSIAYSQWAQRNCMKTCNMCQGGSGMTTPAPKACRYSDGVTHGHGTWWQDGCSADAKNCTCNDGVVKCLRLCPRYDSLPVGWRLVDKPGQCCPALDITIVNEDVCQYKGSTYRQDESWSDGCKLSCVCTDAKQGFYQCREKCPALVFPPGYDCHWEDPAPGKCCRQPKCPYPVIISGYPQD